MLMFAVLLVKLVDIYSFIICAYVLMSWIPFSRDGWLSAINSVLGKICDPYLNLFKKLIPPIGGMVDITPIIALLVLQFGVRLILMLLF